jgi:hypothetical protein
MEQIIKSYSKNNTTEKEHRTFISISLFLKSFFYLKYLALVYTPVSLIYYT